MNAGDLHMPFVLCQNLHKLAWALRPLRLPGPGNRGASDVLITVILSTVRGVECVGDDPLLL